MVCYLHIHLFAHLIASPLMKFGGKICDQAQGYRNIFGARLSQT